MIMSLSRTCPLCCGFIFQIMVFLPETLCFFCHKGVRVQYIYS
ncbi:hypothetical protein OROMI_022169 [Orobanche minor]